jgi:ABC-2 type transport system permease protein
MAAERGPGKLGAVLRLWLLYGRMDFLWVVRGLRAALAWYASDLLGTVAAVTATFLLAERFDGIGSWSKSEVLFMLGFALTARGLLDLFFGMNIAMISRRLGRGQLDHMLIQPWPLWVTVLSEGFAPFSGSGIVIAGVALLSWSTARLELLVTPLWLALVAVNVLAAAAILMSFSYLWGSVAFWAPRGAEEINSQSMRLMDQLRVFPLDGLGGAMQIGLLSVVPVGFVAWFPSRALLHLDGAGSALVTPLASLAFAALAAGVFKKGLEHYGRTGSVRYLSHGHRR